MENNIKSEKEIFLESISNIQKKSDGSFVVNYNNMPYHISYSDEMSEKYMWILEYAENHIESISEYIEPDVNIIDKYSEEYARAKRDNLLNKADIILMKYQEQAALGIIQENNEYYNALLQYRQNLRDITKQLDFPENIIWPVLPEYI